MNESIRPKRRQFPGTLLLAVLCALPSLALASEADTSLQAIVIAASSSAATQSTSQLVRATAPRGIRESFYACLDEHDRGTADTGSCITAERDYQDERLNRTYKRLLSLLKGESKTSLVSAEKAWIASKDQDAGFEATIYGDSAAENLEQGRTICSACVSARTLWKHISS